MDHGDDVVTAFRQHLKESYRARLRKQTPSDEDDATSDTVINPVYQGQFFGPSETVLSDRVIQLLLNKEPASAYNEKMPFIPNNNFLLKHKASSNFKKLFRDNHKFVSSTKKVEETKSGINGNKEKKLKFIRQARDYSFLESDQIPGPEVKARKITGPDNKAQKINRVEDKARKITGPDDKAQKINRVEDKARKINRPKDKARKITRPEEPEKRKTLSKGTLVRKAVIVSKQSQACSRSGKEKSTSEMANRPRKRKQDERDDDISKEGAKKNAIGMMIRKMFKYDPTKYRDDDRDDDLRMEASFRDIEKEERRSAKIAKMEDAEELRKLSIATA